MYEFSLERLQSCQDSYIQTCHFHSSVGPESRGKWISAAQRHPLSKTNDAAGPAWTLPCGDEGLISLYWVKSSLWEALCEVGCGLFWKVCGRILPWGLGLETRQNTNFQVGTGFRKDSLKPGGHRTALGEVIMFSDDWLRFRCLQPCEVKGRPILSASLWSCLGWKQILTWALRTEDQDAGLVPQPCFCMSLLSWNFAWDPSYLCLWVR